MSDALQRLAVAQGIALQHYDIWGKLHRVSDATLRALLHAMGVGTATDADIETSLASSERTRWQRQVAPLSVLRESDFPWRLRLRAPERALRTSRLTYAIVTEAGVRYEGDAARETAPAAEEADIDGERWIAVDLTLDVALPPGYHGLTLLADGVPLAQGGCAVAPERCYRPPALREHGRCWGLSVQLYGLRSERNWGVGDFNDLAKLATRAGTLGASIVGVNPLHALFPHNPKHASPYSPSSRLFLNTLYLDVPSIDDFAQCAEAKALVDSSAVQRRLAALREAPLVDYAGVAALKMQVLELVYARFRREEVARHSSRAAQFLEFKNRADASLARHAEFEALQEHFSREDRSCWGWPAWPAEYRAPNAPAVMRFAEEHAARIDFYAYLQWQADLQRAAAAAAANAGGVEAGLYFDLAVSVDRGGADTWAYQELFAPDASVGAPPDAFNANGQDWGLPPMVPSRLREAGYAPFIALLRANMRNAGALRIDHVMGLMRLFWIPPGGTPADGAYVQYPFEDLLGLVALESQRHQCLVIGEDLGTVPDEVRAALAANDILSYRVLWFERDASGDFKAPAAYPEQALATASTHDLPTLAGWWEGRDIALRADLGLLGRNSDPQAHIEERARDRARLLAAMARADVCDPDVGRSDIERLTPELACAVQRFLAKTRAVLLIVQLDDAFGAREQANLPGTTDTHPNWRRKASRTLEHGLTDDDFVALATALRDLRPRP